jgi:hypothetical protein
MNNAVEAGELKDMIGGLSGDSGSQKLFWY